MTVLDSKLAIPYQQISPEERGQLRAVHEAYHARAQDEPYCYPVARSIGSILLKSQNPEHLMDAGWSFLEAAQQAPQTEIGDMLELAEQAWNHCEEITAEPSDRLRAQLAQSILPTYGERLLDVGVSIEKLYQRLLGLNRKVLAQAELNSGPRIRGIATEIGIIGVLAFSSLSRKSLKFAWPAPAYADKHSSYKQSANYDIQYGVFPEITDKIQAKSWLGQNGVPQLLGTEDGDTLHAYWRSKYDSDITLIFGDVHLWNDYRNPYFANRLLAGLSSSGRSKTLRILAANVLDELAA